MSGVAFFLDRAPKDEARTMLRACCGSSAWAEGMIESRPFVDAAGLFERAETLWMSLGESDWREAFEQHPRIGDVDRLRERFGGSGEHSESEQKGLQGAHEGILAAIAAGNKVYERKFGHLFLVCASGKSAEELLEILRGRLNNSPADELRIAAKEQAKITRLRLEKLCTEAGADESTPPPPPSPITSHVLDLSRGRPAAGIAALLERAAGEARAGAEGDWLPIASGVTDADGRLRTWLPDSFRSEAATYRIRFDTGQYFRALDAVTFYPSVTITFEIVAPNEHHHVPLLLSPFGYSTYRGS